ncbi:hypothetical protein C8J56DRAFT_945817 [Mycena floridula]|nr:hypothetical protein C8J56DRAFT_945817 [Mycena floridula]
MLSAKFILAAFSTFVTVSAAPGAGAAGALRHRSGQDPPITLCVDLPANNFSLTKQFTAFRRDLDQPWSRSGWICLGRSRRLDQPGVGHPGPPRHNLV